MVSAESLYPPTHGYESMEKTTQRRLRGYNRKKRGQGIAGERGETRFGALRQKRPGSGFQRESFEEISRRKKFGELIRTEVGKEDFLKKVLLCITHVIMPFHVFLDVHWFQLNFSVGLIFL